MHDTPRPVSPVAGPAATRLLFFGAVQVPIGLPCDPAVAVGGHTLVRTLPGNAAVGRLLEWICGTVLIGVGVRLALSAQRQ